MLAFLAAASYFALGIRLPLEWTDEGMLLYPGWRVSQGAVLYRDLVHLYGPSFHYLNAALFRLFGEDLLVLRAAIVLWKSGTVTFAYLAARRVAPPSVALGAYLVLVATFGLPLPVFASSYAGHHAMAIVLAGLLIVAALPRRSLLACALAGLCFGLAATFKQTIGAFAFIATALFLLTERTEASAPFSRLLPTLARASRAAVLAGSAAFFGYYLSKANTPTNVVVLLTPVLVVIVSLTLDERRGVPLGCQVQSLRALVALSLGAALPIGAWALWFASRGLLAELVFNTVTGVPDAHEWFTPYRPEGTTWLVWLITTGAGATSLRLWGGARASRPRAVVRWAVALVFAVGAAELLRRGIATGAERSWWFWLSSDLYLVVPGVVAWLGALVYFGPWRSRLGGLSGFGDAAPARRRPTLLFACSGVTAVFVLYPATGIFHAWMVLPASAPLLVALVSRLQDGLRGHARRAALAFVGTLALLLSAPAVVDLHRESQRPDSNRHGFARATGISARTGISRDAAELVALVRQPPFVGRPIFVLSGRQMIYFLAGRASAVEPHEFGIYMVAMDLISDEGVASLIDEDDLVSRLRARRPIIIDDRYAGQGEKVRRRLPRLADYLERSYAPARKIGRFTLFLPGAKPAEEREESSVPMRYGTP